MAKDPTFLFYSSDFLIGCSDLTMEERGQYITLLCLQHQKGHLRKRDIEISIGTVSDYVLEKFSIDENGCYYNRRLEEEIEKRKKFCESRSKNRNNVKHMSNICQTYVEHMENENVNEIINDNDNEIDNINSINYGYDLARKRAIENGEIDEWNHLQ